MLTPQNPWPGIRRKTCVCRPSGMTGISVPRLWFAAFRWPSIELQANTTEFCALIQVLSIAGLVLLLHELVDGGVHLVDGCGVILLDRICDAVFQVLF